MRRDKVININENKLIKSNYNLRLRNRFRLEDSDSEEFQICESDEWSIDEEVVFHQPRNELTSDAAVSIVPHKKQSQIRISANNRVKSEKNAILSGIACDICGWQGRSKRSYERHKLNHFKQFVYQCRQCDQTFRKESALLCHIKADHLAVSPSRQDCPICGKSVLNLAIHILQHTDARFVCETCGKRFVKQSVYEEHLVVHSGVRSFRCGVCQSSYSRKWNWKVHMAAHERNRDDAGRYLPLKPRGKAHEKYRDSRDAIAVSADAIDSWKWRNVERHSKSCDTASLDHQNDAIAMIPIDHVEQTHFTKSSVDASMSGAVWESALYSSRACDTADIDFYRELLRQISDE